MNRKGDANETLPLFFKRDGVPPKMVMDELNKPWVQEELSEDGFPYKTDGSVLYMAGTG